MGICPAFMKCTGGAPSVFTPFGLHSMVHTYVKTAGQAREWQDHEHPAPLKFDAFLKHTPMAREVSAFLSSFFHLRGKNARPQGIY